MERSSTNSLGAWYRAWVVSSGCIQSWGTLGPRDIHLCEMNDLRYTVDVCPSGNLFSDWFGVSPVITLLVKG